MRTKIFTAKETLFNADAQEVVLPGDDGEFSVWDFHQPCMHRLKPGDIRIKLSGIDNAKSEKKLFAIKKGVALVNYQELVVLVE